MIFGIASFTALFLLMITGTVALIGWYREAKKFGNLDEEKNSIVISSVLCVLAWGWCFYEYVVIA